MTGLQLASFWEGNRSQLFATHVLSSVAAVVPVPVPMDFGHDLLCTLTRRETHALHASHGFGVQVKSASAPEVRYGGLDDHGVWKKYELDWLYDSTQPLIICVVDLKQWCVNLYATELKWWVRNMRGFPGEVVLVPDLSLDDFTEAEGRTVQHRFRHSAIPQVAYGGMAGDGFSYRVPLGPPIASIWVKEQEANKFREQLRSCLDAWLSLAYRNLTHRRLDIPYVEEWTTWTANEPPSVPPGFWHFYNPTHEQNVSRILRSIAPAVGTLMHNLNSQSQGEKLNALRPLAGLLNEYGLLDQTLAGFLEQ